ncbi:MAG: T9SS type A sorting domain-containing protein [Chloroflexia bacterium]|nr:T9SS type A sorting domain-containing protein [Chloroflexia bacterium]
MKTIKMAICLLFICLAAFEGFSQDLSLLENKQNEALVYPNPLVRGEKFIVKSEAVISKVEVVNVIGKVINRTENNNFNVKEIPVFVGRCEKGMYFVKVTFENKKSIIKKLLVK